MEKGYSRETLFMPCSYGPKNALSEQIQKEVQEFYSVETPCKPKEIGGQFNDKRVFSGCINDMSFLFLYMRCSL